MKLARPALLFVALALSAALDAQTTKGGAGGSYRGPGDTVPSGGSAGPAAGRRPIYNPRGSSSPRRTVRPNANPAAPNRLPRFLPLGTDPTEPPPRDTPGGRPIVHDPTSWQLWWHYNRWSHLAVAERMRQSLTGTGGFFLGRGQKVQQAPELEVTDQELVDLVAPALERVLAGDPSNEFQIFALHALAKTRELPTNAGLADFGLIAGQGIKSSNQDVAEKAILALGIRGEARFFPWLDSILHGKGDLRELIGRTSVPTSLRTYAAYALGLLGERTADLPDLRVAIHASLSEALFTQRFDIQAACLWAMGMTPLSTHERAYSPGDELGPLTLASTRVDQVLEILEFFEDSSQDFVARSQAPNALARLLIGAPETLRVRVAHTLLVAIGPHAHEPREVQNGAVLALAAIGRGGSDPIDEEIRSELLRVAYKSSAYRITRYLAMVASGEVAARPGRGEVPYAGLRDSRKVLLRQLSLSRGQALAWTALGLGLLEENAGDRGELPDADVTAALRLAFKKNRSTETGGAIAIALGLLRDPDAHALLLKRMQGAGESYLRGYTALALGMCGAARATDSLREELAAAINQPFALQQIALGLALLGDQSSGERLSALFIESANPEVRASIASAMGWIGDPRPLADLIDRLEDPDLSMQGRAWTAVAIGRLVDRDPWPWVARASTRVNYDVELPDLIETRFHNGLLDLP